MGLEVGRRFRIPKRRPSSRLSGIYTKLSENARKPGPHKSLVKIMSRGLRNVPKDDATFRLVIIGENIGSVFLGDYLLKALISALLTKLLIHLSSLKAADAPLIGRLLRLSAFLTEFDCSENDLGECAAAVLGAVLCVPRLCALQLENCGSVIRARVRSHGWSGGRGRCRCLSLRRLISRPHRSGGWRRT
jgi:hypothetical protein